MTRIPTIVKNNGKYIKGGELTRAITNCFRGTASKITAWIIAYLIEKDNNPMKFQNNNLAINRIDMEIMNIENELKIHKSPFFFEN